MLVSLVFGLFAIWSMQLSCLPSYAYFCFITLFAYNYFLKPDWAHMSKWMTDLNCVFAKLPAAMRQWQVRTQTLWPAFGPHHCPALQPWAHYWCFSDSASSSMDLRTAFTAKDNVWGQRPCSDDDRSPADLLCPPLLLNPHCSMPAKAS